MGRKRSQRVNQCLRAGAIATGSGARETHDFSVDVKPGGFAVVDVTTLR